MSELQSDLIRTVDRVLDDHCSKAVREAAEAGEWPSDLWQALEAVGLTRCALPEGAGGFGLEFTDAMLVLRRCAYHAAPVPLAETALAGRLLTSVGLEVPDGPLTVAPVVQGDRLVIAKGASGLTLSGIAQRVPWGDSCAWVVVAAEYDGQPTVALVATAGLATRTERNLAGEPRVDLNFDNAPVQGCAPVHDARERLENEGALYRSVQIVGALQRVLEYSIQYANERVQFGRPIGKFQAVQHLLAVLAGHVAASSAAVDLAVEASCENASEFAVSVAKSRAGEAAGKCAEIAHQVHAAMGYTREHNLHFSTRRLWSWRDEFGNESYWQTRLGRAVAASGADALWPMLTAL